MGKLIGVLMLIGGIVAVLWGVAYVNSPQYKMMSVVNGFTGGSDPTGNIAMGTGVTMAIVGLLVLIGSGRARSEKGGKENL